MEPDRSSQGTLSFGTLIGDAVAMRPAGANAIAGLALAAVTVAVGHTAVGTLVGGVAAALLVPPLGLAAVTMVAVAALQPPSDAGRRPWTDVHAVLCLRLLGVLAWTLFALLPFTLIAGVLLAMGAGLVSTATGGGYVPPLAPLLTAAAVALSLGAAYVFGRLLPWPAAAIAGARTTLRESFTWTSGYSRQLFAATALLALPAAGGGAALLLLAEGAEALAAATAWRAGGYALVLSATTLTLSLHKAAHDRLRREFGGGGNMPFFMV